MITTRMIKKEVMTMNHRNDDYKTNNVITTTRVKKKAMTMNEESQLEDQQGNHD